MRGMVMGWLLVGSIAVAGAGDAVSPTIHGMWVDRNGNGSNFRVTVDASDNIGVDRMDIYLDGNYVGTPTQNGYPVLVRIKGVWWHTVTACVYDAAGNMTEASVSVVGSK